MKYAGKKAGLMPKSNSEVESPAEDKGENEATETKNAPLKKTGTTNGKSNSLGGGGRFQQLKNRGMSGGLAAYIGRKSLGKAKFQKLAAAGKSGK